MLVYENPAYLRALQLISKHCAINCRRFRLQFSLTAVDERLLRYLVSLMSWICIYFTWSVDTGVHAGVLVKDRRMVGQWNMIDRTFLLTRIIYFFFHGRKRRMYLNSWTALYSYIYNYIQSSIECYTQVPYKLISRIVCPKAVSIFFFIVWVCNFVSVILHVA